MVKLRGKRPILIKREVRREERTTHALVSLKFGSFRGWVFLFSFGLFRASLSLRSATLQITQKKREKTNHPTLDSGIVGFSFNLIKRGKREKHACVHYFLFFVFFSFPLVTLKERKQGLCVVVL